MPASEPSPASPKAFAPGTMGFGEMLARHAGGVGGGRFRPLGPDAGSERHRAAFDGAGPPVIGSITYRSHARQPFGDDALDALTQAAQSRNRTAGVTGILLYQNQNFLQCLEGPPAALEPVWDSIRADPRHGAIDVLAMRLGPARLFAGWDMQLLRKRQPASAADRRRLVDLAAWAALALAGDGEGLARAVAQRHPDTGLAELLDSAIAPLARCLGDMWLRDDLDEFALTAALGQIHVLVHHRARLAVPAIAGERRVLAVPFPGDPHLLGAVALAELHINAGWQVDLEFPATVAQLVALARVQAYDRIAIAASDALDRGAATRAPLIAAALHAVSANPAIDISFGGRAFCAPSGAALASDPSGLWRIHSGGRGFIW